MTFEAAADRVKTLKEKPANDTLLKLYGLYKQATVGDNNTSQVRARQTRREGQRNTEDLRTSAQVSFARSLFCFLIALGRAGD